MIRTCCALLAVTLLPFATPAAAEDAAVDVRVIGFSADGHVVVLRRSIDLYETAHIDVDDISVELFDITKIESIKTYPIFEAENDTEADRKRRWNECATELKEQGYTIDPHYAMTESIPSLGVDLIRKRIEPDPEMPEYQIDLYVQKKGGEPLLVAEAVFFHEGSMMNPTSLAGFYLDPTGTYLFAFIGGGGGIGPVIPVADIARKLEAPANPPPANAP